MPLSPPLFNIVLEVLATAIREEKEIKRIQIGKEEVKLSLFAYDMTLYIENPKDTTRKLLELIKNVIKSQDIKLIHRNPLHSYTLTMRKQKKIKETIPLTIATKGIKCLGINLSKEIKDLYIENYKTLVKEIIDDTSREIYHVHRSEESI